MQPFATFQDACTFINQEALRYTNNLSSLKYSRCPNGYVWCMNFAAVINMFDPYNPADQYAKQAIDDFIAKGYLESLKNFGGLKITPLGYQNIGNW